MGSKGRMPPPRLRGPLPVPDVMHPDPYGPGMHPPPSRFPPFDLPPPEVVEQKLAAQHMEMQVLLMENQRLAATQGTLRQELAAAQNELQMLQSQTSAVGAEKEHQMRNLTEKIERMSSELQTEDAIKSDLEQARSEAQKLALARQELISKAQLMTHELQRVHVDVQKVPFMVQELESIRQEFQRCRATYDYEKKLYNDHLESLQVMETNYFNMAKETEKLRAELTASANVNRRPGGAYGSTAGYNESDASATHPASLSSYEDSFAAQHGRGAHPVATGGVSVPTAGTSTFFETQHWPLPQRPGYDIPRVASFYDRQRGPYDTQMQMGIYNHPQQGLPDPKGGSGNPQRGLSIPPHMQAANANNAIAYGSVAPGAAPARTAVGASQPRPGNPARK
uniref:Protein FLX-like 2 n=1 Tax=Kalanchoe fedtschenkoi TaxID=63787 RepID=A0A7N0V2X0_KALFE